MDCDDQPEEDVENTEDAGHEDDEEDSISRDDDEGSRQVVSIIKMLSNFLNELSFNLMVPQSTVQLIIKEYLTLSMEANKLMTRKVVNALNAEGVEQEIINKTSLPYFGVKLRKKLPIVTLRWLNVTLMWTTVALR